MSEKDRYYSVNGFGKYIVPENAIPDKNGMIKVVDMNLKKIVLVKKSELKPWNPPSRVTLLRGGRY